MRLGENFCPGVRHAVAAKDGLLLRIRVPGGLLSAAQLKAVASVADLFADGTVEITSRANLQLRGVRADDLQTIERAIAGAGLLPSPEHDRVRNITASPLAGLDLDEILDVRPLVLALDRRLQEEMLFTELPPKFSFGLHGSPRRFSRELDDLSLEADGDGSHLRLSVAGVSTGYSVAAGDAVDCLAAAARCFIGLGKAAGVPARAKRIIALPGALAQLIGALGSLPVPSSDGACPPAFVEAIEGVLPGAQSGLVNFVPSVPLGRLSAPQAHAIAAVVAQWNGDLRLATWRGIVLGAMPAAAEASVAAELQSAGLSWTGRDGFHGVAACAGLTGCDASLADVRGDAAALAGRLAGEAAPLGWTIHLSGCEKQCARRHGASADLIAKGSGYLLKIAGETVEIDCSAATALDAVANLYAQRLAEAATV